jgi:hypothetical protein
LSPAEDYLLLGLRLGKHVDGLVDAYYGPQDLQDAVDEEPAVHASDLAADGARLRDSLEDGWLRDQVAACTVYARVLAGEELSYSDEVEGCYGVRPERTPESVYEQAHAELDELLPGDGSLYERREAWRQRYRCPGDQAIGAFGELLPLMQARTEALFGLPEGERVTLEAVADEPWWAFNYYRGGLHSHVVVNTDVPTSGLDLLHLVAHEVYPGHHTEHAAKEQLLIRDRGLIEEGIQLVPTPQAVLSEGIAESGSDLVLDDATRDAAFEILRQNGIEVPDRELAERIAKAGEPLGTISLNAALMIHEGGATHDEAAEYVAKWSLRPLDEAKRSVAFVTDPTWRAYTITYSAGEALCKRYVDGDPARFRTLLTEHVRIGELLSA